MLKSVSIQNFQSHKNTELEFAPGVNILIGKSDAGKSAVFRAINWVASNRPLGDAFRSEWGGDTRVVLHTSEGHVVERIKSTTKNEYIINGQILKAFGSEVPEEVLTALQIDSYNIASQMDSPFLLSISPGEAARLLNKAASIDDIDITISGLRKTHTELTRTIKHDGDSLEGYLEQIEQYTNLPGIEEKLKRVERLEEKRIQKTEETYQLQDLTDQIKSVEAILEKTSHVPEALRKCRETHLIYTTWKDRCQKVRALQHLLDQIKQIKENINQAEKTIKSVEQEYHRLAPEICPLCGNRMKGENNEKNNGK